jgi:hypothetical protein
LKSLGAEVGYGEVHELTIKQKRMLEQPTKVVTEKRKAVKSLGKAMSKKAKTQDAPKSKAPKKPKARKLILEDVTAEEKEQAEIEEALRLVSEQNKKEEILKDSYEAGIDPKFFEEIYDKIPPRENLWILLRLFMEFSMVRLLIFLFTTVDMLMSLERIISPHWLKLNGSLIGFFKELIIWKIQIFQRINQHQNRLTHICTYRNLYLTDYLMMQHHLLKMLHPSFKQKMTRILKEPPHHHLTHLNLVLP